LLIIANGELFDVAKGLFTRAPAAGAGFTKGLCNLIQEKFKMLRAFLKKFEKIIFRRSVEM